MPDGQQQRFYVSQPQRKVPLCLSFLACSSILPLWLGSSKAWSTAVDLKSLHSQFRRASVRHALKALRLRHKYSSKSPNLNFANIKIQPFFAISPNFIARQIFPLYGRCPTHLNHECPIPISPLCFTLHVCAEAFFPHNERWCASRCWCSPTWPQLFVLKSVYQSH